MKGSLTVEAACIYPFCFWIIAIVCVLGIYGYNMSVLKMTGYECILEMVNEDKSLTEETLSVQAVEMGAGRVLAVKELQAGIKLTGSKVLLTYRGCQGLLNVPLEVTVVYERIVPEKVLRLLHMGGIK
jgi:hypothetical protein